MLNQQNQERRISLSRNHSSSRKAVAGSSVRATSSADFTENRSSRLVPNNGQSSTTQRTQFAPSSSSLATKAAPARTARDITLQSLDLLTIGNGKRKWLSEWYLSNLCLRIIIKKETKMISWKLCDKYMAILLRKISVVHIIFMINSEYIIFPLFRKDWCLGVFMPIKKQ